MPENGDSGAPAAEAKDLLQELLANCRASFLGVGVLSMAINLLMLTTSLYMMQVFNRVLGSGSRETLLYLTVVACGAVLLLAVLDAVRRSEERRVGKAVVSTCRFRWSAEHEKKK